MPKRRGNRGRPGKRENRQPPKQRGIGHEMPKPWPRMPEWEKTVREKFLPSLAKERTLPAIRWFVAESLLQAVELLDLPPEKLTRAKTLVVHHTVIGSVVGAAQRGLPLENSFAKEYTRVHEAILEELLERPGAKANPAKAADYRKSIQTLRSTRAKLEFHSQLAMQTDLRVAQTLAYYVSQGLQAALGPEKFAHYRASERRLQSIVSELKP